MLYDIDEFKGLYQINEKGEVFSVARYDRLGRYRPKTKIACTKNQAGYWRYTLKKDGKQYTRTKHRLIATTFIDNPENLPTVDHIDGNKNNNNIRNLEWCTYSENTKRAYRKGLSVVSEKTIAGLKERTSIQVKIFDKKTNKWYSFNCKNEAVDFFGTGLTYFSDLKRKYNCENKRFKMIEEDK